jgi:mannose/fructose-specific phosphotransferase system component IIA
MAQALIESAREVYGDVTGCHPVTNQQKSPQSLREEIETIIDEGGSETNFILFVDFFGGSCCHTCVGIGIERDNVRLITGVNLPMLLAFLYKRDEVPFENLPGELLGRGHDSIQLISTSGE